MLKSLRAKLVFVPTLIWNMLLGRWLRVRNWWDRIDDRLILGALPFPADVPKFAAEGVSCVVNTCEEYGGPVEAYEKAGIEQFHMPTTDFTHPKLDDVIAAVDFLNEHTADGSSAYIHCKAGRARSATVAMCWLIQSKGMSPQEAQQLLLEKRPHVNRYVYQRPVVKEFYSRFGDQP